MKSSIGEKYFFLASLRELLRCAGLFFLGWQIMFAVSCTFLLPNPPDFYLADISCCCCCCRAAFDEISPAFHRRLPSEQLSFRI